MLSKKEFDNEIIIENENIQIKLRKAKKNILQEYFVKKDNKWVLLLIGQRDNIHSDKTILNNDLELKTKKELIDINYQIDDIIEKNDQIKVVLKSETYYGVISHVITLKTKSKFVHISINLSLTKDINLEYLQASYTFVPEGKLYDEYKPLDFTWVPNLRPKKNYVIGDHVFRSPAIIVQKRKLLASLIPDLDLLKKHRIMKQCFDFKIRQGLIPAPTFSYGFKDYKVIEHTYYHHKPSMTKIIKKNTSLKFGFYLYLDGNADLISGFFEIPRFLWQKYGSEYFKSVKPQVLFFNKYAEYGYDAIFNKFGIWNEFKYKGIDCAGSYFMTFQGKGDEKPVKAMKELDAIMYHFTYKLQDRIRKRFTALVTSNPSINNFLEKLAVNVGLPTQPIVYWNSWFNNLRTAYGIFYYGKKRNDELMVNRAKKMKNLILSAPMERGIFPSIVLLKKNGLDWMKGTQALSVFDWYCTSDDSWTCYWLLRWYEDFEKDTRIMDFCKKYADFLLNIQTKSGAIPSWIKFKGSRMKIHEDLKESANCGVSVMFLIELYKVTAEDKYLSAAKKAAEFIIKEVFPMNKWYDYETFFSCSLKKIGMIDPYTHVYPQNNLCISWIADSFRELYEITSDQKYLKYGERAINLLSLYQQIWDANIVSINSFGGFGVMNTDAEWNDARQSIFAIMYLHYYRVTGKKEYFERGIAAIRSSFVLMLIEENKSVAAANMSGVKKKDYGASFENYGHSGRDEKILGYITMDWGTGSSLSGSAHIEYNYGDVYIDVKRQQGFGINGCILNNLKIHDSIIEFDLISPFEASDELLLKINNTLENNYILKINNKELGTFSKEELNNGIKVKPKKNL